MFSSRNVFIIKQVRSCIICVTKKVAFGNVQALIYFRAYLRNSRVHMGSRGQCHKQKYFRFKAA